jgi:hypothetical protein
MGIKTGPKILIIDIETAPIEAYTWGTFDQNISLDMIKNDWTVLSWSAKWFQDPKTKKVYGPHNKIMYMDTRNEKDVRNDKVILGGIWHLLNEADICVTQNGISFDIKKLNARFVLSGFGPTKPIQQIDTLRIAKKHFAFTSNKLAWMTNKMCKKFTKSSHKNFPGFMLWDECLKGNKNAWKEMEKYNKRDITSLEELYSILRPWSNDVNYDVYNDELNNTCSCGSNSFKKEGFRATKTGKYQRYRCSDCGSWAQGKTNLLQKTKRQTLRK